MSPLRLAVVGLGAYETSRARSYVSTIVKLTEQYTLCAICDASEESLKLVGDQHSINARYTDYVQMLENEKPDVVFVLVPTDGQTPCALTAVEHGCHIITEIPYAITLSVGDEMARICEEKGVKWEIAENVWRWPQEQLKQEIVRQGLLGKIVHARLYYTHGSYHGFNGIRKVLDKKAVRAMGYAQEVEVLPYESYGGQHETTRWWDSGTIEFENDITCLYEMPPSPSPRSIRWEVEGTKGYLSGSELVLFKEDQQISYPFEEIYEEVD
ncbi:MAG: Gfo/Idh/MocA family oxidoreductase, partial [Candidatus Latescibacteria bacterium]|nr:Gfo/Idh/MocA family oxidoreductase [Candidatus Latescibacterota bacterium]